MRCSGFGKPALLAWFPLALLPAALCAQQPHAPKRVLVLYWYNMDFPGNVVFEKAFRPVLESAGAGAVEYYAEYLETDRFPEEQKSLALMDYLRRKYAGREPDVVVTSGPRPQELILRNHETLFPRTPVVIVGPERPTRAELGAGPGVTGVVLQENHGETLDLALRLHPQTEHVFIVSGTLERDGKFERLARNVLQGYRGGAPITYLTDLAPDSLLEAMTTLPPRSIVLYVWQQARDRHGRLMETADVLATIAQAPVPIYGLSDWNMGRGIIGGQLFRIDVNAARAAAIVLQIVSGARARDIPLQRAPTVPMFDWRQLRRWGIAEKNLPPGSLVRFKELSVWNAHPWETLAVISFVLLETLLVGGLLVQRARRKRIQEGLSESERALRESHSRIADLAGRLITAQDEERKHIARELHDDLSQQVAGVGLGLSELKRRVPDADPATREQVTYLQDQVVGLSEQIRRISHELHSATLQHVGLAVALRQYCEDFTARHALAVELQVPDQLGPVPPDVALCLYRVVQQSLQNVAKHSGARAAAVRLAVVENALELRVTDRGAGFDPAEAASRRGLGVISMEERVRLLHGSFQLHTRAATGTEIIVHIPLAGTHEQAASIAG
jgi:signal transduction histidine kinase